MRYSYSIKTTKREDGTFVHKYHGRVLRGSIRRDATTFWLLKPDEWVSLDESCPEAKEIIKQNIADLCGKTSGTVRHKIKARETEPTPAIPY